MYMIGGYVEHVLHVTDCALKIKKLWESDGAKIDFTDEEMIFSALHHDLGKVGDLEHDYYIPCESECIERIKVLYLFIIQSYNLCQ